MNEIWKAIPGYEGIYEVSNIGKIKSLPRNGTVKYATIRTPCINYYGYYFLRLHKKNISKNYMVHRLVGLAFIPNPNNKPQINHKDGNKSNNCVENLEWVTASENTRHSFKNGLQKPLKGEDHGMAKLKKSDVIKMRAMNKTGKYLRKELANIFKISCEHTSDILNNKKWRIT